MTILQANEIIGKKVDINLDGLVVPVKILDVKTAYGNLRFRVSAGLNSKWMDASRVTKAEI
jgi:hypothetical protein